MNLPSPRRTLPVFALLLIGLILWALPHMPSLVSPESRYAACNRLAASAPAQAVAYAQNWLREKPDSLVARHCDAIALYAAKDYTHAAELFVALAKDTAGPDPILAARVLLQAARAYDAAGNHDKAAEMVDSVFALDPGNNDAKALAAEIAQEKPTSPPAATPPATATPGR